MQMFNPMTNELMLGLLLGVGIGFVAGVLFALYVLPLLAHSLAGRTRDRG
jgi:hypothetical protein